MQVTLKGVKHYPSMSEETNCFEAVVYADGKKVGYVSNRGCGGENEWSVTDRALYNRLQAYATTLPRKSFSDLAHLELNEGGTLVEVAGYAQDADSLVDDALMVILREKEDKRFRKMFEKDIDTKVLYVKDGAVWGTKYGPMKSLSPEMLAHRKAKIEQLGREGYCVLNTIPSDKGFALWKRYVVVGSPLCLSAS